MTTLTLSPVSPGGTVAPSSFITIVNSVIAKARLDSTADLAKTKGWVNDSYRHAATETRCLQTSGSATLTSGTSEYTLDANIHHIEEISITASGQAYPPLEEVQLDQILRWRAVSPTGTGPASKYALVNANTIELWPTPAAADTITFWYSYLPAALSADADVPLLAEPYGTKLLEFGALVQAAEFKRDLMMLGDFQQQYASWMAAFQRYLNRKAGAYPQAFTTWTGSGSFSPHDRSTDVPRYPGL